MLTTFENILIGTINHERERQIIKAKIAICNFPNNGAHNYKLLLQNPQIAVKSILASLINCLTHSDVATNISIFI